MISSLGGIVLSLFKILNTQDYCNELDYLFFPKVENRKKLFERIRKNFVRLADGVDLQELPDGRKRPIYY